MLGKSDYGNAWEQNTLYNISVIIMQDLTGIGKRSRTNIRDSEETVTMRISFRLLFFYWYMTSARLFKVATVAFVVQVWIYYTWNIIYIFLYYNKSSVWLIALNPSTVVSKTRFFEIPSPGFSADPKTNSAFFSTIFLFPLIFTLLRYDLRAIISHIFHLNCNRVLCMFWRLNRFVLLILQCAISYSVFTAVV